MAIRKASAYSHKIVRPYTRKSAVKSKAYIKAVPQNKIAKFSMGNQADFEKGKHKFVVKMVSEEKAQLRDTSMEASRMFVHKSLEAVVPGNYFFQVKMYPHHIQRENKSAGGQAGADRLSTGMTHSFGTTIGRAAIVPAGKEMFFISCLDERTAQVARKALSQVKSKLPVRKRIVFEKLR